MTRFGLQIAALAHGARTGVATLAGPVAAWRARFGPVPADFSHRPDILFPGDANRGRTMAAGRYAFDGAAAEGRGAPWTIAAPTVAWAEALHGFGWLADFAAAGDADSRRRARAAVAYWIDRFGGWHALAWRPAVTGRRLRAWAAHSALLTDGADPVARRRILASAARQTRYLRRRLRAAPPGAPRLQAVAGLVYAGLCLKGFERLFLDALEALEEELGSQLYRDGGHFSRRPSDLFEVFALTIGLRHDLMRAGGVTVGPLSTAIEAMAPTVRMLRLGDGGMALFNGGRELDRGLVDLALAEARVRAPARKIAPDSGFARLAAGRTAIVMEGGAPPAGALSAGAAAGALAIEASLGRRRLIVSCGPGEHLDEGWARAGRSTAAHSTVTVGDASSATFLRGGFAARMLGERAVRPCPTVRIERVEDLEGAWIRAAHDGYAGRFGLIHERRLFLSADGADFRGEDTVTADESDRAAFDRAAQDFGGAVPFAARFHLHPDVDARLLSGQAGGGGAVSLRLPGGDGWVMRQSGGALALEDSVYLGGPARRPRATRQIVVRAEAAGYLGRIKWAFRRAEAAGRAPRDLAEDRVAEDDGWTAPQMAGPPAFAQ